LLSRQLVDLVFLTAGEQGVNNLGTCSNNLVFIGQAGSSIVDSHDDDSTWLE
jgi:hypothetical protein